MSWSSSTAWLLEEEVHRELNFSAREWNELQELVTILQPFLKANCLTQGGKILTISIVLPSVLSWNHYLEDLMEECLVLEWFNQSSKGLTMEEISRNFCQCEHGGIKLS